MSFLCFIASSVGTRPIIPTIAVISTSISGSDDIVLVVVDAKSVDRYRWPWKREFYCNIFEYLKLANPKLIIHDALITTLDKEDLNSDLKYFSTIKKINNLIKRKIFL